jgi:imidazolonepropionase-like amidohydrolase
VRGALERIGLRTSAAEIAALRDTLLRALSDGGAGLLLGSDSPQVFSVPGFSLAHEMEAMVAAGLPPWAVLTAATRNPAEYFGRSSEFGTVEPGKRADLILIEGNPLEDIRNVHRQAGVMVRGQWLSADEISRRLDQIAQRWRSE